MIKVEPPAKAIPGAHIAPMDERTSVFFRNLNRGKQSVVLDLKDRGRPRGAAAAHATARTCWWNRSVPASPRGSASATTTVSARNPAHRLLLDHARSASTAPIGTRPAHDLALEALTGVLSLTLGDDGRPAIPGIPIADMVSALQGLSGVLMALLRRHETGRGDYIDIAMHDALFAACPNVLGPVMADGRHPVVKQQRSTGGSAFYQIYETRDGRQLVLAGQETKFVARAAERARPAGSRAAVRARSGRAPAAGDRLSARDVSAARLADWMEYLAPLDVCFAPVNTLPEALDDPNLRARSMLLTDDAGRRHIAPADPLPCTSRRSRCCASRSLGEHTRSSRRPAKPDP